MRDAALVRQASLKATGADIHAVKNLIGAYEEACRLRADSEAVERLIREHSESRERLLEWAAKWKAEYEDALRAYVGGTPVRKIVGTLHGPWWYRMKIKALVRSATARVRRVGGLRCA